MSNPEPETLDYFELIALCADKMTRKRPVSTHPQVFWRETVGKQWRNTYQHMTRPVDGGLMWRTAAYKRELAMKFAALSRLAAMAAWSIGQDNEDDVVTAEKVLAFFEEAGTQMAPKIH